MLTAAEFFELTDDLAGSGLFDDAEPVWSALDRLGAHLSSLFEPGTWPLEGVSGLLSEHLVIHEGRLRSGLEVLPTGKKGRLEARDGDRLLEGAAIVMAGAYLFDDRLILGPGSVVEPGALVKGPTVVGAGSEIRQAAYVRGNCLVGDDCVVGHTTEIKASILLDGAKAGHFAYIGDSILGRDVNLGAGTKLANLKMIPGTVAVKVGPERVDTGRRKLGAVLGDRTETGCNSVTSPGTLVGPGSMIYPTVATPPGFYEPGTVFGSSRPLIRRGRRPGSP